MMKYNAIKKAGTLFLFLLFIGIQSSQAQFWKKLEKRATKAAEDAVLRKAENKAAEKAENGMDSIFEAPNKVGKKKKGKNKNDYDSEEVVLPDSYSFEWRYALQMESEAIAKNKNSTGDIKMMYYLNNDSPVFGTLIEMPNTAGPIGKTIMIMDSDNGTNLMLMEMNGQKIMQKMPSFQEEDIDAVTDELDDKNYKVEKTDTKIILGYTCQGFKITSEDGIANTYVALDAPVSFNNTISSKSKFKPKGFDPRWLKEFENGLMMEVEFTSNKKEKYNMKMTCVALEKAPISINVNAYKSFMELGQE